MLPLLGILPLLAAGAILGALQIRWVGEATRAEENSLRISMAGSVAQVRNEAEDEIRILISLTHVTSADFHDRDWQSIASTLQLWHANSRFPTLLRNVFIVLDPSVGEVLQYSKDAADFRYAVPFQALRDAVTRFLLARKSPGPQEPEDPSNDDGISLVPIYGSRGGPDQVPLGFMALDIDKDEYFHHVVPYYMEKDLPGYPYRIYDIDSNAVYAQSGETAKDRMPEAAVNLMDPGVGDMGLDLPPIPEMGAMPAGGSGPERRNAPSDPFLQSWLKKIRADGGPGAAGWDPGTGPKDKTVLAVFYPKVSLAATMRRQAGLNLGLGLGMITLLLAGILVISAQYRHSVKLRASEQDFVASISHELRTPIAVIQATSENLCRGVVSDPARLQRYAEAIHGQIKRLAGMVESILLYSGLQSGASRTPAVSEIDLPSLLEDIAHPLRLLAADKGSELRLEATGPAAVCSDRMALRIILENLLMNAIRHASPSRILFTSDLSGGFLRFRVEDDGPGIPSREQSKVFDAFVRGQRSIREQRPGSGIGLHLVKRVVGLLGGKVILESPYPDPSGSARNGCRFTVLIPYREHYGDEQEH